MLKINNISFGYTPNKKVLSKISFKADKGDYIAVVGESGCGKSTLLELIYGLLHPEEGTIYWNETKLLGPKFRLIPGEEFIKYLPQDFDLMPYTTVEENVGKNISNLDPNRVDRIHELLKVVDMTDFLKAKVKNLSGGQKQRVAIAKVLAKEPEVLLLDEPFSHIDNFRKNALRRNLFRHLKSKKILCIVATHDTTDALSFADEIIVIRDGNIAAKNIPEELYKNKTDNYIGSFFNEVNTVLGKDLNLTEKKDETFLFYPEDIKIVRKSGIKAVVIDYFFKGSHYLIEAEMKSGTVVFFNNKNSIRCGTELLLSFKLL